MITLIVRRVLITPIIFLIYTVSTAQSPGLIVRPAGGPYSSVLNPNQNGYTSSLTSGFSNNDISESEVPYKVVPPAVTEPTGDLATGPSGGFTDIVKTVDNSGFYTHSNGTNLYFRLRIGGIISGSKGYSILIDTDGKMGSSGVYADPNYVAPTNTSNGNPGFEYEVVFRTNFNVEVFDVNGPGNPVSIATYPLNSNSQISVALSRDGSNPDYFYDWYVPLSALGSPSSIRLAATTVTSPSSALQGSRSDIYGIDDASSSVANAWETVIKAQPFISISAGGMGSVGAVCTAEPTLNSPIAVGSSVAVSGTWTRMDASKPSTATITLYRNNVALTGITTTVSTGSTWTITVPTVSNGDVFYAKALAAGESECLQSASVTALSCTSLPTAPIITCASQKGITGTIPAGSSILLYQVNSATGNPASTPIATNITYPTSTSFAYHNNLCGGSGSPLTAGITYMVQTVSAAGCISGSTLICIQGSASVNNLPTNTIAVTAPVYPFHTSISGTNAVTGELIRLFINDIYVSSLTATGSTFSFTGLSLKANDVIKIYSQGTTCTTISPTITVSCYNVPPVISTDINGRLLSTATSISGSSIANASITLNRTSPTTSSWTTTANSTGSWTVSGLTLASGDVYAATVTSSAACASASQPSASASVVSPTTVCPTITGTYTDANTSVTGSITTSATGKVRLYLDDVLEDSFTVASTGTSTWTISPLKYPLYNGGVLRASFQAGTNAENLTCPTSTITCTSPATPLISPGSSTITAGQTVNYSVSNVSSNTWYAVMDANSISYATSIYSVGTSNLAVTTKTFSTAGTYNVRLSADKLTGCPSSFATATIIVNPTTLAVTFKKITAQSVDANINISWDVSDESNVAYYVIERSYDCRDFESIGTVPYKVPSSSSNQYHFKDNTVSQQGKICYRVKQVDITGKHHYSSITSVSLDHKSWLTVWPNPAVSQAVISLSILQPEKGRLEMYDAAGKKVWQKQVNLQPGTNTFSITNLKNFKKGLYHIQIATTSKVYNRDLIIQ